MAVLQFQSRVGLAIESAWGTAATAPTVWIPWKTLKMEDDIKQILDSGKRGSFAKDFNTYNSVMTGKGDIEGNVFPETIGYFLKGIFGQDTVTGTGPYTHSFTLSNNQPSSFSLFDYDGVNERVYAGSVLEELGFKFTTDGDLTNSVKFQSKASAVGGSVHTPTFANTPMFLGFQNSVSIGGSTNTRLIGGDLNIKRAVKMTFGANNSQSPTKANVGALDVTGKLDFEIDDYTELNYYLNSTQPTVVFTFTSGTNILTIQMTKCAFEKINGIDRSQDVVRISANIRGLYNATDAGSIKVTLQSAIANYN
ncbi:phage tail tube protein [Paenibacillus filicis]|uniref:Phage tail tube protein n=1 Tax=Paenibacillus gyeongsangnamensis TaxID=3388067 RepID=A0ABT4Q6A1_9BACL|nr:phage tail tube protein [Paenibacillus filicis]MCZ8512403.1 phage tail tube protein [Paenibacillus filicis]